jgi:RNA polymerase sigma-70 factor (ECF subfamily)
MLVAEPKPETLPVDQAIAGNPDAWDQLLRRYQLPLFTYVSELTQDRQGEPGYRPGDVHQCSAGTRHVARPGTVWQLAVWHCPPEVRAAVAPPGAGGGCLEEMADLPQSDCGEGPADLLIRKEREAEFLALLNRLPTPQRSTLLLFFLEQFSIEEIAAITATPEGTVKSRLHYAKSAFRKLLEEEQP